MSREIKFRAWNKTTCLMIDLRKVTPLALDANLKHDGLFVPFSKDIVLMQYTGLKDKNGKDIYEGDIVKYTSWENKYNIKEFIYVREVKFKNGRFFPLPSDNICEDGWYSYGTKDFEVIGNVFENPELLK